MPSATSSLEPRRLLLITAVDLAARNGPAKHVLSLASHLAQTGPERPIAVTLLARQPSGDVTSVLADIAQPRLKFHFVGAPANAGNDGRRSASAVPALLLGLLRQPRPDAVYLRAGVATAPLALAARRWRSVPLVVEANSWNAADLAMMGHFGIIIRVAKALQISEARLSHRVRTVTAAIGEQYQAGGVAASAIRVIGNGADLDTFHPLDQATCRRALGLPEGVPILALISNLWSAIDLISVFRALRLLNTQRARNIHLMIAGDGVDRVRFETEASAELGAMATTHVRWLGAVSHETGNRLLGAADAGLAPFTAVRNRVTGLSPLKVRECAAAGRPCIGTALPGLEELRHEPWMYLANPDDAASWAKTIDAALAPDPHHTAVTRQAARAYAETHYGWSAIAAETARLMFGDGVTRR